MSTLSGIMRILYKKKSLFYRSWYDNEILLIGQLINRNVVLLSYSEFPQKFRLPVTTKEYAIILSAIPNGSIQFLKTVILQRITSLEKDTFLLAILMFRISHAVIGTSGIR